MIAQSQRKLQLSRGGYCREKKNQPKQRLWVHGEFKYLPKNNVLKHKDKGQTLTP